MLISRMLNICKVSDIILHCLRQRLLLIDPDKFSADALRQHRAQERMFCFDAVVGPGAGEDEVQSLLGAEGLVDQLVRLGHNGTGKQ